MDRWTAEGSLVPAAKFPAMATPRTLERIIFRRGVGDRAADCRRCADCRRTPLVGERLYHYDDGRVRCELCRPLSRHEPIESELVHGVEHGHAVRITVRAA
jgi:hypothetical protein